MTRFAALVALSLALLSPPAASAASCHAYQDGADRYTICRVDPARERLRVYHAGPDGRAYGSFAALQKALWPARERLVLAVNGGMYHPDLAPVGLLVEEGVEKAPVSTRPGYGNFHLLPNGIFLIDGKGYAEAVETGAYLARRTMPRFATQSGPMLVIDGELHPAFLKDSDSFKIRNGIGRGMDGILYLVQSESRVRFYDFARLFRDRLGVRNALYLDGTISSLHAPAYGRRDNLFPLGPIIAVTAPMPL